MKATGMPELKTLSVSKPMWLMENVIPYLVRHTNLEELELFSIAAVAGGRLMTIFRVLKGLDYFSCNMWTTFNLHNLRLLNEHTDQGEDTTIELPLA